MSRTSEYGTGIGITIVAAWRVVQDSRAAALVKQLGREHGGAREPRALWRRLGCEGFQPQALYGAEVLEVGGEERQVVLEGGSADQGIGQAQAVR
jgi:hypothetical protein